MADDQVTHIDVWAKTTYAEKGQPVPVNSAKPIKLSTDDFDIYLMVRIKDYKYSKSEETADHEEEIDYFQGEHANDSISIQFSVTFKKDVPGADLKWGNDWDNPIRDILPWGFSAAFASFKYLIDPGVDGDVYADNPWIYGAALSSINKMEVLDKDPASFAGPVKEENPSDRHKKYLDAEELSAFTFEKGKTYSFDFVNPYLIMSSTPQIRMPGFTFDVGKYAGLTDLRYVLKAGDELVFAVVFSAVK